MANAWRSDVSLLLAGAVYLAFSVNYAGAADTTGSVVLVSGETLYSQSSEFRVSTPYYEETTQQYDVSLHVVIESPTQSAPESELRDGPALPFPSQLNGVPVNGSPVSEGDQVSSPSESTETLAMSTPASDVSSSPVYDKLSNSGELQIASVKSAPQADRRTSPV